jgi:ribosome-associated protein
VERCVKQADSRRPDSERRPGRGRRPDLDAVVRNVVGLMLDKKGGDPVILDLRKVTDATDFFVMVSGETGTHARAIADHVVERLREDAGIRPWHVEGHRGGAWILLDYVDFVVHVFEKSTREYYQLERLWGDAEVIRPDPAVAGEAPPGET